METGDPDAVIEMFEERAAILEYEAGWPRAIAESEARRFVTRLAWMRGERRAAWIRPPGPANDTGRPGGRPGADENLVGDTGIEPVTSPV